MRFAAFDYGESCGIAISDIVVPRTHSAEGLPIVGMKKYVLATALDNPLKFIEAARCRLVVLEDYPRNAKNDHFDRLKFGLEEMGYKADRMKFVAASQWKPLAKAMKPDLSPWNPETKHEREAMSVLWYYLQFINWSYSKLEVRFV